MMGIVLGSAVLAVAIWVGLLSLRIPLLAKVGCYWFGVVVAIALSTAGVATHIASALLPSSTASAFACKCAVLAFRATLLLNPQVNVRGTPEWDKLPRRAVVLLNHTSWLDSVIFVACTPLGAIHNFRTLLKAQLLDIPLAGHVFKTAGHFPVYFHKDEEGSWSIDKERQAPVQKRLEKFVQNDDAYLSFYPEGTVNKDPRTLLSFRRGSFQLPVDADLPVYAFLMVGNEASWPAGGLPGLPADIDVKLFRVCDKVSKLPENVRNATALSEYTRDIMQNDLNSMLALREGPTPLATKKVE